MELVKAPSLRPIESESGGVLKGKAQLGLLLSAQAPTNLELCPRASQGYLVHFLVYCGRAFPRGSVAQGHKWDVLPTVEISAGMPRSQKEEPQELTIGWIQWGPFPASDCNMKL